MHLLLPITLLHLVVASSFLDDQQDSQHPQNVLSHQRVTDFTRSQCPYALTGPIETTLCDFESLESVNDDLYYTLERLVRTPYFRYYRADLYRECPFWQENGFCMHRECGITSMNESEIPEKWRAATLSKLERPSKDEINALPGCYSRDSDYCFLDDLTEGDYVDLRNNPEQFTGYSGPSAHRVWSSIYKDNCFGISEATIMKNPPAPAPSTFDPGFTFSPGLALTPPKRSEDESGQCLEKQVYYKIISGLHASISTHVCYSNLDQKTGKWGPDLQCFVDRVASHPERLQYIYFNTVLLLRAIARAGPYLTAYDYCSGDNSDDGDVEQMIINLVNIARSVGKFDETVLFRGENANIIKSEFKEHFRNVTRIMDCVGCDKCRLWGKIQTTGVGTALKLLFELDENTLEHAKNPQLLQRTELVALVNTLHRFSESLKAFDYFRDMWAKEQAVKSMPPKSTSCQRSLSLSCLRDRAYDHVTRWAAICSWSVSKCTHLISDVLGGAFSLFKGPGAGLRPDL